MKKYPKIVKALINLEKAVATQAYIEPIELGRHKFPVMTYCGNSWINKPYTYFVHKEDFTPFVHLNKN